MSATARGASPALIDYEKRRKSSQTCTTHCFELLVVFAQQPETLAG